MLGRTLAGTSIDAYMEIFCTLDKRAFQRNKGYIQAIDALCKRLCPERYTEDVQDQITLKPAEARQLPRGRLNG